MGLLFSPFCLCFQPTLWGYLISFCVLKNASFAGIFMDYRKTLSVIIYYKYKAEEVISLTKGFTIKSSLSVQQTLAASIIHELHEISNNNFICC